MCLYDRSVTAGGSTKTFLKGSSSFWMILPHEKNFATSSQVKEYYFPNFFVYIKIVFGDPQIMMVVNTTWFCRMALKVMKILTDISSP